MSVREGGKRKFAARAKVALVMTKSGLSARHPSLDPSKRQDGSKAGFTALLGGCITVIALFNATKQIRRKLSMIQAHIGSTSHDHRHSGVLTRVCGVVSLLPRLSNDGA